VNTPGVDPSKANEGPVDRVGLYLITKYLKRQLVETTFRPGPSRSAGELVPERSAELISAPADRSLNHLE
jgi:hypothetical protein